MALPTSSTADAQVRKNLQQAKAVVMRDLSSEFRNLQQQYLLKLKQQKTGASGGFDFLGEEKKGDVDEAGFTSAQMQAVVDTEALVQERDEEIAKIARSIEELSGIFKELA